MSIDSFEIPNVFRVDQVDAVVENNKIYSIQLRCPHCSALGTFGSVVGGLRYKKRKAISSSYDIVTAAVRMCPNPKCCGLVFTITSSAQETLSVSPPELLECSFEDVPAAIAATLKEAIACHSAGSFRASAMMVRRLLEELCEDAGVEGRTLHDRLKGLRTKITLPEELFNAMDELKALGNDAAHIEAKSYAMIDREEAELSIELAKEIVKARFQHKSLVERLKSRKTTGAA
ncbi:DUF4145 domain-containing protein [Rhodobacter capsulatus]|uniref:DUF4145 domain-containing protein n=1 Tax=Rhodobacter capsulatus TaxID=1061 RepID=UPI0040280C16